jgi:hypothetical protein
MFDRHGKFIKSISQRGLGPADHIGVQTVIVDSDHRLFYLITLNRILKYTFEGVYVETVGIDGDFACGIMTPNHTLLFYERNFAVLKSDTSSVPSLIEMDTLGNRIRVYPNPEPRYRYAENQASYGEMRRPLYLHSGEIHFNEYGNDTLFATSDGVKSTRLIIDLGDLKMDHNPDFSGMNQEGIKAFANSETKLRIRNICEDDNYYFIDICEGLGGHESNRTFNCILDKNTNDYLCLDDSLSNTIDGGITFYPKKSLPDGTKLMWKNADAFKEEILSKDYNTQKAKYGEKFEKVYKLASSLQEDDNPVLILAK